MKYTNIVFDVDGTLLDTEEAVLKSFQVTLEELGIRKEMAELSFCLGITGKAALEKLGIDGVDEVLERWLSHMEKLSDLIHVFDGIRGLLEALKGRGISLGVITSRIREEFDGAMGEFGLDGYFDVTVCAEDTIGHKPDAEPMKRYLELTGADPGRVLYVGDSIYDMECAKAAGTACGLALWGCNSVRHIRADHYFPEPYDVLCTADQLESTDKMAPWLDWAIELQFIARAGLTYSKDNFDLERFGRLSEISAEILSRYADLDTETVATLFCTGTGYQTPKLDCRAAIFEDGKILLVKERDGRWSLPGGWVDVNQTIGKNTVKEVKEEAGLDVAPVRLIALQDMRLHNVAMFAFGVCKVFVLCCEIGGAFEGNIETVESRYFGLDELPELSVEKNTREQVEMCFAAYRDENWRTVFD